MESTVIIGIVLYIIYAVAGGILRSILSQGTAKVPEPDFSRTRPSGDQSSEGPHSPSPQSVEAQPFSTEEVMGVEEDKIYTEAFIADLEDGNAGFEKDEAIEELPEEGPSTGENVAITQPKKPSGCFTREQLAKMVIASEIIREPRSRRPWPQR